MPSGFRSFLPDAEVLEPVVSAFRQWTKAQPQPGAEQDTAAFRERMGQLGPPQVVTPPTPPAPVAPPAPAPVAPPPPPEPQDDPVERFRRMFSGGVDELAHKAGDLYGGAGQAVAGAAGNFSEAAVGSLNAAGRWAGTSAAEAGRDLQEAQRVFTDPGAAARMSGQAKTITDPVTGVGVDTVMAMNPTFTREQAGRQLEDTYAQVAGYTGTPSPAEAAQLAGAAERTAPGLLERGRAFLRGAGEATDEAASGIGGRLPRAEAAVLENAKATLQGKGYELRPGGTGKWIMPDGTGVDVAPGSAPKHHGSIAVDVGGWPSRFEDTEYLSAPLLRQGWVRNATDARTASFEVASTDSRTVAVLEQALDQAAERLPRGAPVVVTTTLEGEGKTYLFSLTDYDANAGDLRKTLSQADVVPTQEGLVAGAAEAGGVDLATAFRPAGVGARAAATTGERAFDLGAAGVGAAGGVASAPEDATWQERAGRGVLGAALGAPAGASLRALGRQGRAGLSAASGIVEGGARTGLRAPSWGELADVATSAPLLRPTSVVNNTLGGFFRTAQRWSEESAGALAVDRSLKESTADLVAMAMEVPSALRQFGQSFRQGGTATTRAGLGAAGNAAESLVTRPGKVAQALTAGTRINVATDEVFRQINKAGATARAAARGITDPLEVSQLADEAADFVSFAGKASRLAEYLGGYRKVLTDPAASGPSKAFAALMVSVTPYIRTPERVLQATGRLLLDPVTLPASVLSKNGLGRAALQGNQEAKREVAGRLLVSGMTFTMAGAAYAAGTLFGSPPKDATLRRQLEANGAQWNTLMGVPLRPLGNFGQAMGGLATALGEAQRTYEKGADGSDVVRSFLNTAGSWALEESYLSGVAEFAQAVGQGRLVQKLEAAGADAVTRPLSGLGGFVDPIDPYEREKRGTRDEFVEGLPGGRFALPAKVDPATGQPIRRAGSAVERFVLGSRGRAETPEARELARMGVTATEFKPQEKYAGVLQTPEARRALQETYGRLTGQYVRETMARPEYRAAGDAQKAATLERQIGLAQKLASLEVGDRVARDPEARYELEWLRTPQFQGVTGTPDAVARKNLEIAEAKQLLSEYRTRDGTGAGTAKLAREDPAVFALAMRPEIPPQALAATRARLRRETGAVDTRSTAALPGAGNRVLPTPPAFTAP